MANGSTQSASESTIKTK